MTETTGQATAAVPATTVTTARPGLRQIWLQLLVSALGAYELAMASTAGSSSIRVMGILSGLAVLGAPWLSGRARPLRVPLLLLGSLPFAALTWWTLVTPLVALAILAIGIPATKDSPIQS